MKRLLVVLAATVAALVPAAAANASTSPVSAHHRHQIVRQVEECVSWSHVQQCFKPNYERRLTWVLNYTASDPDVIVFCDKMPSQYAPAVVGPHTHLNGHQMYAVYHDASCYGVVPYVTLTDDGKNSGLQALNAARRGLLRRVLMAR